jgi:glutaconate CoA-transferase, subunit B
MRAGRRAVMLPSITQTFLYAQRGFFDYGFLGGAQIDPHGNINTSVIGPPDRPRVRLPGSGGACDIITHCRETFIVTMHERRRFVEQVDFVTSPGYLGGRDARRRAGLLFGEITAVVTDLALMRFDSGTRRMRVDGLQAGVTIDQVRAETAFDLAVAPDLTTLPAPTSEELRILRMLDPDRLFLG